jgi:predicted TPR repeat methyltransferase
MEESRADEAEQLLREGIAVRPESVSLSHALAELVGAQGRYDEAISLARDLIWPYRRDKAFRASYASWLARAGERMEQGQQSRFPLLDHLAELWNELNETEKAIEAERLLDEETSRDPNAAPIAPDTLWVRSFFDCFAEGFDERLKELDYRGPQALRAVVDRIMPGKTGLFVVDLGCGTGLVGAAFKPMARRMIGIDLSSRMLARAHRRGIYQQLVKADIMDALKKLPQRADLIVASDVLIYLGALESLFEQLMLSLRPGGHFAATVEKCDEGNFKLLKTRRYAHSENYIRRLAAKHELRVLAMDQFPLRRETKTNIEGLAFVVGKQ